MKDYKEVFVGQLFKAEDEPTIKVLEIGRGLAAKYPNLSSSGAQHGLDEGVDVRYSTEDEEDMIADYIDFIDYTYSNCYDPNKKAPNGTGNMEPEYKREEDDHESPCEQYEPVPGWDILSGPNDWPNSSKVGNCWCGHELLKHMSIYVEGQQRCIECQCVNFTLDKWVTQ